MAEPDPLPANLYEVDGRFYYRRHNNAYRVYGSRKDAIKEAAEANAALGLSNEAPRPVLSAAEIARAAVPARPVCGVYFLLRKERIVYVGQSTNVYARLGCHASTGGKEFDAQHVIECELGELNWLEALYIVKFRPEYNRDVPDITGISPRMAQAVDS